MEQMVIQVKPRHLCRSAMDSQDLSKIIAKYEAVAHVSHMLGGASKPSPEERP